MESRIFRGWEYFIGDTSEFDRAKTGKWMKFFNYPDEIDFIAEVCELAVKNNIVAEAKYSLLPSGIG